MAVYGSPPPRQGAVSRVSPSVHGGSRPTYQLWGAHSHRGPFHALARKQRYQLFTNVLLRVTTEPWFVTLRLHFMVHF